MPLLKKANAFVLRILLFATALSLRSVAQTITRAEILKAASDIQEAVRGTDQLRLRVNRYCRVTITHEPEEALLRVISAHILNQKYDIPASEMLYVVRASAATESQLLLWSGDCAETGASTGDAESYRLALGIENSRQSLNKVNERFWDLLSAQIVAEEGKKIREQ